MKSLITIILLLLTTNVAMADSLDISLTSFHFDDTYNYNTMNIGIGYTKDFTDKFVGKVGVYNNSYEKTSIYALLGVKQSLGKLSFGLNAGFVTGYDDISDRVQRKTVSRTVTFSHHYKDTLIVEEVYRPKNLNAIQFMILPTISYMITDDSRVELGFIPSPNSDILATVTVQLQIIL